MNCPSCGVGVTFLGDWDNAMQYKCEKCKYEISMTKTNILRELIDFKLLKWQATIEDNVKVINAQFKSPVDSMTGSDFTDWIDRNKEIVERLKKEIGFMSVSSQDYHSYEVGDLLEEILEGKK